MIKPLCPRVGVAALASPMEVGANRSAQAADDLTRLLNEAGCAVAQLGVVDSPESAVAAGRKSAEGHLDAVVFAPASWFEDYLVLDFLEEYAAPVLFWPLPGMETGALCGTQQLTCYLRQLGQPFAGVFGMLEKGAALDRSVAFLRAATLRGLLRRSRIGLAGARVRGMTYVAPNEMALKKTLGPRVVPVDMVGLLKKARDVEPSEKEAVWKKIVGAAGRVTVSDEEGLNAAGLYVAIKRAVYAEGFAALAFGCYPDFMGYACLSASLLADEGIPVACEGDVHGAIGMLMLTLLTGRPTHNADWLDPLPDGSVVFTHCGSGSYALAEKAEDITVSHVRLARQGVCSLFPAKSGPVTLINILPVGAGYQMAVMEGEALPAEMVFPGNPLRVRFDRPVQQIIDWIFAEGIGHHWMAGYGQVGRVLEDMATIIGAGLRFLRL